MTDPRALRSACFGWFSENDEIIAERHFEDRGCFVMVTRHKPGPDEEPVYTVLRSFGIAGRSEVSVDVHYKPAGEAFARLLEVL